MYKIILFLAFALVSISNCESKSSDDEEKNRLIGGIILSRFVGAGSATTNTSCSTSAPAFSSLASAGVATSCARSGCHLGSSPASGFDATSFTATSARVTPRNPGGSLLYQKVNGGSMSIYTSSEINTAIFCWIQGGALP